MRSGTIELRIDRAEEERRTKEEEQEEQEQKGTSVCSQPPLVSDHRWSCRYARDDIVPCTFGYQRSVGNCTKYLTVDCSSTKPPTVVSCRLSLLTHAAAVVVGS